ncbi:MAG: regulator, partial [Candidatus Hydrogenedentes bacterium]|nr:regulator [Candidatus Hydrogenedentota bacterium]
MRVAAIFWLSWCFFLLLPAMALETPVPDVPFDQEFHVPYPLADEAQNEVRSVAVDGAGQVWAATRAGVYVLPKGEKVWRAMLDGADAGPAFDVFVAKDGVLWAGAWNGAYRSADGQLERVAPVEGPVAAIGETSKGLVLLGPNGMWMGDGTNFAGAPLTTARSVRRVLAGPEDALWVCTGGGLYNLTHSRLYQEARDILSCSVFDAAYANDGKLWVGGLGGVTIYERGHRVADLTPKSGLPTIYVQAVERDAQGRMWVGTTLGIARYDGGRWSIRNSRRWLVNDDVRDLAFDADGNAWIATAGGVSALMHKPETLADKGNYFQHLAETRHTRPPGFVEKVRLETPGDYETWQSADDDNDGEYTSMYLVSQSYRYAATKDEAAR